MQGNEHTGEESKGLAQESKDRLALLKKRMKSDTTMARGGEGNRTQVLAANSVSREMNGSGNSGALVLSARSNSGSASSQISSEVSSRVRPVKVETRPVSHDDERQVPYMNRPSYESDGDDEPSETISRPSASASVSSSARPIMPRKLPVAAEQPPLQQGHGIAEGRAFDEDIGAAAGGSSLPIWICKECNNECIKVTRESRCLCGHRLKEHKNQSNDSSKPPTCSSKSCKCAGFYFVVAEGAWCIRCRCKHKHTEHDPSSRPSRCMKCTSCSCFDSPWVCNCGHGWAAHIQQQPSEKREVASNNVEIAGVAGPGRKVFAVRQDGLLSHLNNP